jgi:NACHT domain
VPLPVRVGAARIVERPDASVLRTTFTRPRAVVCVVGAGGSGKSTLACAVARRAMADDPTERLASQRMVPVFLVNDTTDLIVTVTRSLREMLGDEELPDDLMRGLLAQQRLLVIVDALSEREPETQRHVEEMFASSAVYNAVVITSRVEPRVGAVERTMLYPLLLDQKRIVPFIVDYVAQLEDPNHCRAGAPCGNSATGSSSWPRPAAGPPR